jgi:hypothetical protein
MPVTAGVHPDGPANAAGHSGEKFQPGKTRLRGDQGGVIKTGSGSEPQRSFLQFFFSGPAACVQNNPANPRIRDKDIGPAAKYKNIYTFGTRTAKQRGNKRGEAPAKRPYQAIRGPACFESAVFCHRFIVKDFNAAGSFFQAGFDNAGDYLGAGHALLIAPCSLLFCMVSYTHDT